MVEAIHKGKLKSLYLFGEEMGLVDANSNHVQSAFEKLNFFVVQDIFFSKTAQFADVVLPASPSLEKDLNNGRLLEHFHEGNMRYRTEGLIHKVPGTWLEVSHELAEERNLSDGTLVRLSSPYGQVKVRALVTDRVKG